jgi:hypothetical protein
MGAIAPRNFDGKFERHGHAPVCTPQCQSRCNAHDTVDPTQCASDCIWSSPACGSTGKRMDNCTKEASGRAQGNDPSGFVFPSVFTGRKESGWRHPCQHIGQVWRTLRFCGKPTWQEGLLISIGLGTMRPCQKG